MSATPAKTIEIKPKIKYLSAEELITQRHAGLETQPVGLKRTIVEGSVAEQTELTNAYANLRQQLSGTRIERQAGRAIAIWRDDQQAAEVVRKDGKFDSFGHSKQGKLYLEYYEALFLLQLNRLQLEYCGSIVSIEQAYLLLLGEAASEKYNNYLVYSTLSRAGYIVVQHQVVWQSEQGASTSLVTSETCIWALLDEALGNNPVPAHIKASSFYNPIQARMVGLQQQIMSQTTTSAGVTIDAELQNNFKFETRKRKAQPDPGEEAASKRANTTATKSLVDNLKAEATYTQFQQTFEKLDIVQLQRGPYNNDIDDALRSFRISFDLHLHNEGFKRSAPKPPTFSVVILPSHEPFPTNGEILNCQRQVAHSTPLLVVSISESKQMQAFLYYIS